MSRETQKWLDENTLIGFTAERGNAWHWRAGTDNHFAGAVPLPRVRKLFGWEPVTIPFTYEWKGRVRDTDRIAVVRGDNGNLLGMFKDGYQPHAYGEWLVDKVEAITSKDLKIGSAGLLKGGGIAWVSVEVPESVDVPIIGETIRPWLTAATSFDGTLATTYKRGFQRIVCDNTLEVGLAEKLAGYTQVKVKHTKTSTGRLNVLTSRDALGIMADMTEDIVAEITALAKVKVPVRKWSEFLDLYVPVPFVPKDKPQNAVTIAERKRESLNQLYTVDPRVAPWSGTAWGVLQAVNTHNQHIGVVRGTERADRNMENALKGKIGDSDREALNALELVLAN